MEEKEIVEKDMTPILIKDLGMLYHTENSKQRSHYGIFKCQYCGNEFRATLGHIKRGTTSSCGCLINKHKRTHGLSRSRFYSTWNNMMNRCYNIECNRYDDYGGRGIKVYEEWHDTKNFVKWAEETHIEGYTLDRIDNDRGYSSDNCRWADKTTQVLNRGIAKNNKSGYTGVNLSKRGGKWRASIRYKGILKNIGYYNTPLEGALARDKYIKENNLPHKLAFP